MKEDKDQIIQRMLEQGLSTGSDQDPASEKDLKTYKMLFNALREEPEMELSADFAATVRARVEKSEYKLGFKFNFIPLLVFITAFGAAFGLLFLLSSQTGTLVLNSAMHYKWVIVSAALVMFGVQYFDQKLMKDVFKSGRVGADLLGE